MVSFLCQVGWAEMCRRAVWSVSNLDGAEQIVFRWAEQVSQQLIASLDRPWEGSSNVRKALTQEKRLMPIPLRSKNSASTLKMRRHDPSTTTRRHDPSTTMSCVS